MPRPVSIHIPHMGRTDLPGNISYYSVASIHAFRTENTIIATIIDADTHVSIHAPGIEGTVWCWQA